MRFLKLRRIQEEARALLDEGAWRSQAELSRFHKFLHFWVLVWMSFSRNRGPVRAAALAYGSLLALIPMLAVVMSITSSFLKNEGEERIDEFIMKLVASVTPRTIVEATPTAETPGTGGTTNTPATTNQLAAGASEATNRVGISAGAGKPGGKLLPSFAQQEEAVKARKEISRRIHEFIQNTRSSALGVTGSVALIFVAISLLGQIEVTFNDIWGAPRGRGWFMRVVLYWSLLSLAPLLLVVALGLSTGPHWEGAKKLLTSMPWLASLIFRFLPVLILCLVLALFYRLMPNTKVHWSAALVGGLVGGLLWHLNNLVSVFYVSRVVSSSKIYGSLGLVPVFMVGLYLSWWILLFGAQVAYAFQNRVSYLEQREVENIDQRGREVIALRLMAWIARSFLHSEPPPSVYRMSKVLSVPTRLIEQLMQTLCCAHLAVGASGPEPAYLPSRPLERITVHDILLAMRSGQGQQVATRKGPATSKVYAEYRRVEHAEEEVASSMTLLALAEISRAGIREPEAPMRVPGHPGLSPQPEQQSISE